jgi:sec-independent protein translocase protein TatA
MPFGIQPWHLIAVVIVALIIFGPARLPDLGRSLGRALSEFRRGAQTMTETFKEEVNREVPADPVSQPAANSADPVIAPPPGSVAASPARPAAGNFCTACGTANPAGARFCNNCGAQIQG